MFAIIKLLNKVSKLSLKIMFRGKFSNLPLNKFHKKILMNMFNIKCNNKNKHLKLMLQNCMTIVYNSTVIST